MGFSLDPDHPSARLDAGDLGAPVCGVGTGLRRMFDEVVSNPMPPDLVALCDALEDAFRRGRLGVGDRGKSA